MILAVLPRQLCTKMSSSNKLTGDINPSVLKRKSIHQQFDILTSFVCYYGSNSHTWVSFRPTLLEMWSLPTQGEVKYYFGHNPFSSRVSACNSRYLQIPWYDLGSNFFGWKRYHSSHTESSCASLIRPPVGCNHDGGCRRWFSQMFVFIALGGGVRIFEIRWLGFFPMRQHYLTVKDDSSYIFYS